jgi:hypothetical protein
VRRGSSAASVATVADVTAATLRPIIVHAVARQTRLHTDESRVYVSFGGRFAAHETVMHSAEEYVRGDVHTNSVESFFAILKRGIYGTYHHVSSAVPARVRFPVQPSDRARLR